MLNLAIIEDELAEFPTQTSAKATYETTLKYPKIVLEEVDFEQLDQVLYVMTTTLFTKILPKVHHGSFLVVNQETISNLTINDPMIATLFVTTDHSLSLIFNTVEMIFQKYSAWEQQMILEIVRHHTIPELSFQKLLDIGVEMLKNPIAMFDISSILLFHAGQIPTDISHSIWQGVLTTGRYHTENLTTEQKREVYEFKMQIQEPAYKLKYNKGSNEYLVSVNLFNEGNTFATLGSADVNAPFTPGQISIIYTLKKILELAYAHEQQLGSFREMPVYFIENLLKGENVEQRVLDYHLNKKNWKTKDTYLLLTITGIAGNVLPEIQMLEQLNHYSEIFSDNFTLTYKNSMVFILHTTKEKLKREKELAKLQDLLLTNDMKAGVSAEFYEFSHLKYAHIQSKTALSTMHAPSADDSFCFFEDIYQETIIHTLAQHSSLKSLIHPKIFTLWEEKRITKEQIAILATYLSHGKNTVSTAKKLFLHRNTLTYKLTAIENLLGMSLNELEDPVTFWLYCSCLFVKTMEDNTSDSTK